MLSEALNLVLQLPPLAFNSTPPPLPFQPPRELTCPVADLGRPWAPPVRPSLRIVQNSPNLNDLRPHEASCLGSPLADVLLLLALSGLASSTGGTVEIRTWPERHTGFVTPPLFAPMAAKPGF